MSRRLELILHYRAKLRSNGMVQFRFLVVPDVLYHWFGYLPGRKRRLLLHRTNTIRSADRLRSMAI